MLLKSNRRRKGGIQRFKQFVVEESGDEEAEDDGKTELQVLVSASDRLKETNFAGIITDLEEEKKSAKVEEGGPAV